MTSEPSAQQSVGQRAVAAVLKQVTLSSTVLAPRTGKPLPNNGAWSTSKETSASCPPEGQCVTVFYRVADDDVSCEWVVDLNGGNGGSIVNQNADASRYLIRKIPLDQLTALVLERKQPEYPPIARAAHVQGEVVLRVFVSDTGSVENTFVVSGPEMLRSSAIDGVKKWKFKPLKTGETSTRFETDVTFDFSMKGLSVTSKP